jgi:acyl-CoA thioesterase
MTVGEAMTNGHGTVHGGFIFALADSAFAFACNSYGDVAVAPIAASRSSDPVVAATASLRKRVRSRAVGARESTTCK